MKNITKINRLGVFMIFGAILLLWITMIVVIGPPDEAPPFITPGP